MSRPRFDLPCLRAPHKHRAPCHLDSVQRSARLTAKLHPGSKSCPNAPTSAPILPLPEFARRPGRSEKVRAARQTRATVATPRLTPPGAQLEKPAGLVDYLLLPALLLLARPTNDAIVQLTSADERWRLTTSE